MSNRVCIQMPTGTITRVTDLSVHENIDVEVAENNGYEGGG